MIKLKLPNIGWIQLDGNFDETLVRVDDFSKLPVVGITTSLYITEDTNFLWRWDGTQYKQLRSVTSGNGITVVNGVVSIDESVTATKADFQIISINDGITEEMRDAVLAKHNTLIEYNDYIYEPCYTGDFDDETIPTYYSNLSADEGRVYYIVINWEDLEIIDEGERSLIPIEEDDNDPELQHFRKKTENNGSITGIYYTDKIHTPESEGTSNVTADRNGVQISSLDGYLEKSIQQMYGVGHSLTNAYTGYYPDVDGEPVKAIRLGTSKNQGWISLNKPNASSIKLLIGKYFGYNAQTGEKFFDDSVYLHAVSSPNGNIDSDYDLSEYPEEIEVDLTDIGTDTNIILESSNGRMFVYGFIYGQEEKDDYVEKKVATTEDVAVVQANVDNAHERIDDVEENAIATNEAIDEVDEDLQDTKETIGNIQIFDVKNLPRPTPEHLNKIYRYKNKLYVLNSIGEAVYKHFDFSGITGTSEVKSNNFTDFANLVGNNFKNIFGYGNSDLFYMPEVDISFPVEDINYCTFPHIYLKNGVIFEQTENNSLSEIYGIDGHWDNDEAPENGASYLSYEDGTFTVKDEEDNEYYFICEQESSNVSFYAYSNSQPTDIAVNELFIQYEVTNISKLFRNSGSIRFGNSSQGGSLVLQRIYQDQSTDNLTITKVEIGARQYNANKPSLLVACCEDYDNPPLVNAGRLLIDNGGEQSILSFECKTFDGASSNDCIVMQCARPFNGDNRVIIDYLDVYFGNVAYEWKELGSNNEIIDISNGLTEEIKRKVTANPASLLIYNERIYTPCWIRAEEIPTYYSSHQTDERMTYGINIDWEDLEITEEFEDSIKQGKGIIVDEGEVSIDEEFVATKEYAEETFVEKESGKTLMSDSEHTKLAGISNEANKVIVLGTTPNGYVVINGTETKVYDDSNVRELIAKKETGWVTNELSDITGTETTNGFKNVTAITGLDLSLLKVGDNVYVKDEDAPDYWVSNISGTDGICLTELATKIDLSIYYNKTEINELLAGKANLNGGNTFTGNQYFQGGASITNSGYVVGTWLQTTANIAFGSTPSLFAVISNGWIYSRTLTQVKTDLGVPTKVSDLENDSGYVTSADLETKVDKETGKGLSTNDLTDALVEEWNGKTQLYRHTIVKGDTTIILISTVSTRCITMKQFYQLLLNTGNIKCSVVIGSTNSQALIVFTTSAVSLYYIKTDGTFGLVSITATTTGTISDTVVKI